MSLTPAQLQAIAARGNVLVVAGAGTGKTRTLVERCLNCLLEERPPASLDEILMVTFTEAAATEMRQRIRARLEEELKNAELNGAPAKVLHHWHEQLALFEAAHIGTLHSFCLKLVRQHFYELGLDPQLSVLAEEESRLLAQETLEQLLQKHYAGQTSAAKAVLQLIQTQAGGSDQPVRALVFRLHEYTQTLANPSAWLDSQLAAFGSCEPKLWENWLLYALTEWSGCWQPLLRRNPAENEISGKCVKALETLPRNVALGGRHRFAQHHSRQRQLRQRKENGLAQAAKGFPERGGFLLLPGQGRRRNRPAGRRLGLGPVANGAVAGTRPGFRKSLH